MRVLKVWLLSLAAVVLMTACGDGSVRSPGLVGPGDLLSMTVECRQNSAGGELVACDSNPRIAVPLSGSGASSIAYRVMGTFEDGSTRDITDLERITLSVAPTANASVRTATPDKGRITARQAGPGGADVTVTITARDSLQQAANATAQFAVFGRVPVAIAITNNSGTAQPAYSITSGVVEQFRVRVTFGDGSSCLSGTAGCTQTSAFTWTAREGNNQINQVINSDSTPGRFRVNNTSTSNTREFAITVAPPSDFSSDVTSAQANVSVPPARFVAGSLELLLQPNVAAIPIEGRVSFRAVADFRVGNDTIEVDVTQSLDSLVSDAPNFAAFQNSANRIDTVLVGLMETPANTPVTVTATFTGTTANGSVTETDTATIRVLEADVAELQLVRIGVAPFEAAGFFDRDDLSEDEVDALRETIARDALRLGLTRDGLLPCAGDACPNGSLGENQTLPTFALPYAVFVRNQGDARAELLLTQFNGALTCSDEGSTTTLNVQFQSSSNSVGTVITSLPNADGDATPTTTASGIRIALLEGVAEGETTLRARLGAGFDANGGVNCRSEPVEDAEQDVLVGLGNGGPAIDSTRFAIHKHFACVGFANAVDLIEGEDITGGQKLRSSLTYGFDNGSSLITFANQNRNVGFRVRSGPATVDGQACRNDVSDPELETNPVIRISNGFAQERGVITAAGALALGNNCAAAEFTPATTPPGFDNEALRAATIIALPVADDDIVRGPSAIGDQTNELCDTLAPLLTLPIGAAFPGLEQGSGALNEVVLLLGALLEPVLNNRLITNEVSGLLDDVLEGLSSLVGGLLSLPGFSQLNQFVLQPLLCLIGLPGCQQGTPVPGFSLLPTVLDGLGSLLQEVRNAAPGENLPEGTPVADPFDND